MLTKKVLVDIPQKETVAATGMFYTVYEFGRALSQTLAILVIGFTITSDVASKAIVGMAELDNFKVKGDLISSINLGFRFFTMFLIVAFILAIYLCKTKLVDKSVINEEM